MPRKGAMRTILAYDLTVRMFNITISTKFFVPRHPQVKILNPKHEIPNKMRFKFEYRISNIEIRNNFKISILKIQNLPMRTSPVFLNVLKLVFWVFPFCFEFRISCFEFCFPFVSDFEFRICNLIYTWRPLWFDSAHHPEFVEGRVDLADAWAVR